MTAKNEMRSYSRVRLAKALKVTTLRFDFVRTTRVRSDRQKRYGVRRVKMLKKAKENNKWTEKGIKSNIQHR
jgi:hypothetical protein